MARELDDLITGLDASRELPIIWRITKGSLKNKIIILLPIAMLLANLLPFVERGCLLRGELPLPVFETYWPMARAGSFAPSVQT